MAENKPFAGFTDEELSAAGYAAGRAFALLFDGMSRGIADGFAELAAEAGGVELVNGGEDEEPELKTDIRDCRACWCDTCAKLEDCEMHRDGEKADGLRPLPCIGCVNGLRFRPKEEEPCEEYEEAAGFNNG